jgi:anti-sigma-K factor RskA
MVVLGAWLVAAIGTVTEQKAIVAETQRELADLRQQVNIPPGYRALALAPTAAYTGVSALVIYNPESTEAWLVADGLQPLPDDLIYELWLIRPPGEGRSDVGGTFGPTDAGTAVHRTEGSRSISAYAGFAVSIERKPGVQVREGPVVVVGRFEGQ